MEHDGKTEAISGKTGKLFQMGREEEEILWAGALRYPLIVKT